MSLLHSRSILWGLLCLFSLSANSAEKEKPEHVVPRFLNDARDVRTQELLSEGKITVLVFMEAHCPNVKLYAPFLNLFSKRFAEQKVRLIGVYSGGVNSESEIKEHAVELNLTFPLVADPDQILQHAVEALKTPQVIVMDEKYHIRYSGAINDLYGESTRKPNPRKQYLENTMQSLLNHAVVIPVATPVAGCYIQSANLSEKGEEKGGAGTITYHRDIAPIIQSKCLDCHRGKEVGGFMPLGTYKQVALKAKTIAARVADRVMPPWRADPHYGKFRNDLSLTDDQIRKIVNWVELRMPEGDPRDFIPTRNKTPEGLGRDAITKSEWRIGNPDVIFDTGRDFEVPEEGIVPYTFFPIKADFKQDRYLLASECQPGDSSVVHHIVAYVLQNESGLDHFFKGNPLVRGVGKSLFNMTPEESDWMVRLFGLDGNKQNYIIGTFVPGNGVMDFPPGVGITIPAGADLMIEVHYQTIGEKKRDRSRLGMIFSKTKPSSEIITMPVGSLYDLKIPQGDSNFLVQREITFSKNAKIVNLRPHMHLRGKRFDVDLKYPDGRKERILSIPKWDFNWQTFYDFAEPFAVPRGTKLVSSAYYDNSDKNPYNPDPKKEVRFGLQSNEEMMFTFASFIYE